MMNSKILVGVQFSSVLLIVSIGKFPETIFTILLFAGGMLLGITSILYMRLDNLRIFPEPKKDIRLVTTGPYRILRHPMYTSLLLMTASYITESQSYILFLVWCILIAALLAKIRIEELLLPKRFPEYSEYIQRSWKLIPYLY